MCYLRQYLEVTVQTVLPIYTTCQPAPSSAPVNEIPVRRPFLLVVHYICTRTLLQYGT
jgi:hypothetical protein